MQTTRRGTVLGGLALAASATAPALAAGEAPVARTTAGRVRGYLDDGICAFRGIRYGATTAGRRFQSPLAPDPWTDVREATRYGPASPQRNRDVGATSEDCLFLNV